MTEGELLQRISRTLKQQIGPAIEDEYAKTQAFMAAVVAEKLGRQMALAQQHQASDRADIGALLSDLNDPQTSEPLPAILRDAVAELLDKQDKGSLCRVIEALYASQNDLGEAQFDRLLSRVRITLRAEIDRQMEYAA